MVNNFVLALFPAWVDVGIELVAVGAFPVVASEGRDIGKGVVVEVEWWQMAVAETFSEEVDQPLP